MKKNVMYLTTLALAAVMMASTGCKHKPVGVTPLTERQNASVGDTGMGQTLPPGPAITSTSGGIAENPNWKVEDCTQDRDKLAAYSIHFAYDSAVIRDNEQGNIQAVAQALQSDPSAKLLIEGNCDERGTEEYNRSLGERRALAAREALAGLNIDPNRIRTISYGKDKPVETGHDEAAWAKNRHDDFVVLHLKTAM